ncbi:MAG TPA: DUF6602 domain-containing protein [Thermoanaerobaculia bacterium]|jgi:hypothetical protein
MQETSDAVIDYFRAKRRELMALAELPVSAHAGLRGSHREEVYRTYLSEILPHRYSVGRGIVYGLYHRSREADIVIWDSHAYPSLPLRDHAFFFAESVRAVLECKSNWSLAEFRDVLVKSQAVRGIVPHRDLSLRDEIAGLRLEILSLKAGQPHQGMMISGHHIAAAAMFLTGGQTADPQGLIGACHDEIDFVWPEIVLLLEPGILALRFYHGDDETKGGIAFFRYGEDVLLAFTTALLKTVDDRVVHSEARFYLDRYGAPALEVEPFHVAEFRLWHFAAAHVPLWR